MRQSYQVVSSKDSRQLSEFLAQEGQFLLPMLELITQAEMAVDELIDVAGRATIEAVLTLSAQEVAGPRHLGRKGDGKIGWHGRQRGVVCLAERKLRVSRPRLRRKGGGAGAEVEPPAYAAMQSDSRLGRRMLEILMHGVSTRNYRTVLPDMADTAGVSKSSVSRQFVDASEESLKKYSSGEAQGLLTRVGRFFYDPRNFKNVISAEYWSARGGAGGRALHHWLIPQRATWIPKGIRNAGFNLLELPNLRGIFHPRLSLNTWMGFATRWGGSYALKAGAVEWGIRVVIPGGIIGGGYAGWELGEYLSEDDR